MFKPLKKVSIRGSAPFGRMQVQHFFPHWYKSNISPKGLNVNLLESEAVKGLSNLLLTGNGFKSRASNKKKALPDKEVTRLLGDGLFVPGIPLHMQDGSGGKKKGKGLFIPGIPLHMQDGSGKKKAVKKLNLSSNDLVGNGFRFE